MVDLQIEVKKEGILTKQITVREAYRRWITWADGLKALLNECRERIDAAMAKEPRKP